nr:site-2 protease family protein [Anaerolineae bacterium]
MAFRITVERFTGMQFGNEIGFAIIAFIVVIGPLIFLHELGHFWAARLNKIKVEEFGIGFPPRMLTLFERNGTKYTLNWLPMGGFMRPAGEDDLTIEGGLAAAPKMARFQVLIAGSAMNFLVALVLLVFMFIIGAPEPLPGVLIEGVEAGSPAEQAGIQVGDMIMEVNGATITHYEDLKTQIYKNLGEPIVVTVYRDEQPFEVSMTPRAEWPEGQGPTGILMQTLYETKRYGPFAAIGRAFQEIGTLLKTFVELPGMVVRQQIEPRYLRPVSMIGISQLGGQAVEASIQQDALWPIVQLTAFISLALAITNLLPIPALDGGRIMFVLLEALRGSRIKPEREALVHFVGFAILIAAMLVFMYLDIVDPLIQ